MIQKNKPTYAIIFFPFWFTLYSMIIFILNFKYYLFRLFVAAFGATVVLSSIFYFMCSVLLFSNALWIQEFNIFKSGTMEWNDKSCNLYRNNSRLFDLQCHFNLLLNDPHAFQHISQCLPPPLPHFHCYCCDCQSVRTHKHTWTHSVCTGQKQPTVAFFCFGLCTACYVRLFYDRCQKEWKRKERNKRSEGFMCHNIRAMF